jgi:hypothetical protein
MVFLVVELAARRRVAPLIALFAVVGSPLIVSYLFLARGYTFSTLFLVAAAVLPVALRRESRAAGVAAGAVALALGTWPIPTNAFVAPGWVAVIVAFAGIRVAALGTGVYVGLSALLFAPIWNEVRAQSKIDWVHTAWWRWVGDVVGGTSLVPACLALVAALSLVALVKVMRRAGWKDLGTMPADAQIAALAFAMSLSWFLSVAVTHAFGLNLPFVRNSVPALWLALVGVVAALPRGRLEYVALALLLPAVVWGLAEWSNAGLHGSWGPIARSSHNDVFYGTTPATISDLSTISANRIVCSHWDRWVCELVTPNLRRSGISVMIDESMKYTANLSCAIGTKRPPSPWQVLVYRNSRPLGVLCH